MLYFVKYLVSCLLIGSAAILSAQSISQNLINDDIAWGIDGWGDGGVELYDERSVSISGLEGLELSSMSMSFGFEGTFYNSAGLDLNADGVVDYVATRADAREAGIGPAYKPWVDAQPLRIDVTWTRTDVVVRTFWDGVELIAGSRPNALSPGFSNLSGMSLIDLGLSSDFVISSASFTTDSFFIGSLNSKDAPNRTASHNAVALIHNVTLEGTNGELISVEPVIPEPSALVYVSVFMGFYAFFRSRGR